MRAAILRATRQALAGRASFAVREYSTAATSSGGGGAVSHRSPWSPTCFL